MRKRPARQTKLIRRETWDAIRAAAQAKHGTGMRTDQRYHEAMNECIDLIRRDLEVPPYVAS